MLIAGVSIKQLGPTGARQLVGVVMQEDQLLAGTLAENIACFDPDASRARVEAAAQKANVHKAILNMPMGYETLVSEMGNGLSGGQKQRVLLARVLYRQPRILALDEATSHLDLHNEQHVVHALRLVQATRITIAHRPETVMLADRLLRIESGCVVEDVPIQPAIAPL